jgi:hypothetical protein
MLVKPEQKKNVKSDLNNVYFPTYFVLFPRSVTKRDLCTEQFRCVSDDLLCAEILRNSNVLFPGIIKK